MRRTVVTELVGLASVVCLLVIISEPSAAFVVLFAVLWRVISPTT